MYYCPLSDIEIETVPGIGDGGAMKITVSLVTFFGSISIRPSLSFAKQVELLSNPVPLSVTVVPPKIGPSCGSTLLITGSA